MLDEEDRSNPLSTHEARVFRSSVGILLYLSVDLLECQCTSRALASSMTAPTVNSMNALRHLGKYLLGARHQGLMLKGSSEGLCIESFSDSDWVTNKQHRRSVSASVITVGKCLLYSSSRAQRVVALSSGEAELLSAASSLCDALFVAQCVGFLERDVLPCIYHNVDAVAAKGMMERSGVGRVRRLSVRVLRVQDLVDFKVVILTKVATSVNVADLGTKSLSRSRTHLLLFLLGSYDCLHDRPIGEAEYAEMIHKHAVKDAVRVIRRASSFKPSKQLIRGAILAVASELGQAMENRQDDQVNNDNVDEIPAWVARIIMWAIAWWIPDSRGHSTWQTVCENDGMSVGIIIALIFIVRLIFRLAAILVSVMSPIQVQMHDQQAVQVNRGTAFNRPLNVSINLGDGAPAPGTPANPVQFDSDVPFKDTSHLH